MKNVKDFFIKNKTLFIIVLLLVVVIGSSWAYFASQVTGSANVDINVTTDIPEEFILNVEKDLTLNVNIETLTEASSNLTDTTNATATFKAGTNKETTKTYNVYFNIAENEYDYTTIDNKPEILLSITGPNGEITDKEIVSKDVKYVTAIDKDSKAITGFDITNYQGLIKIAEDYQISAELGKTTTQEWTFTLTFINLASNQKDNANKTLSSKILLQKDKLKSTIESNIETLLAEAAKMNPTTEGTLLQHTQDLENGANDNGYRYSGNNPNNFICFGAGSEEYNNGRVEECPLTNQYRIIGLVPVTKEDGSQDTLIKVIQSEYATKEQLEFDSSARIYDINNSYSSLARIQNKTNFIGIYWNLNSTTWTGGYYNYWSKEDTDGKIKVATLNEVLNNPERGYISKLKNSNGGIDWTEKIEEVEWNVGGVNTNSVTPKVMKENEEKKEMGGSLTSKAKIGLMYIYDYGYASAKENWGSTISSGYNSENNRSNNWLFNGVYEWTISRYSSLSYSAFRVYSDGSVYGINVDSNFYGVRPVFYLKSDVKIIVDEKTIGNSNYPFRVQ